MQNGDVCKDCTQIFELLIDLISNPDLQVGTIAANTFQRINICSMILLLMLRMSIFISQD